MPHPHTEADPQPEPLGEPLGELTLPAGSLVHVQGIPFFLKADTVIQGHTSNFVLLLEQAQTTRRYPRGQVRG